MQILNLDVQCKVVRCKVVLCKVVRCKVVQWNQREKEHATPEGGGQLAGEYL
jgi:hypothetical protein